MGARYAERLDVVVPVRTAEGKEYEKLLACCQCIRANIPVNRLIMSTANMGERTVEAIKRLADIAVFDETALGAGRCRKLGLTRVETEFYASVDSDTVIPKEWYPWCIETIRHPKVAACQGYSTTRSRLYSKYITIESLKTGRYADLGQTLLRTEAVREVEMPADAYLEDHILQKRLRDRGYEWIVNPNIVSINLLDDFDVFKHHFWFGRFQPVSIIPFCKYVAGLIRTTARRHQKYGLELSIFLLLADLCYATGSLSSYYSQDNLSKPRQKTSSYAPL